MYIVTSKNKNSSSYNEFLDRKLVRENIVGMFRTEGEAFNFIKSEQKPSSTLNYESSGTNMETQFISYKDRISGDYLDYLIHNHTSSVLVLIEKTNEIKTIGVFSSIDNVRDYLDINAGEKIKFRKEVIYADGDITFHYSDKTGSEIRNFIVQSVDI
ncbi:MAG: hypothetical protein Q4E22_06505 [Coriobacteriia bacterium]|nr:hypothetical protein [Coriobacteriia bacterium]